MNQVICCDVGFNNFGWVYFKNNNVIKYGIIQLKDKIYKKIKQKYIISSEFYPDDDQEHIILEKPLDSSRVYKTESTEIYFEALHSEVCKVFKLCKNVICEMPHGGGQSYNAVFYMTLSVGLIFSCKILCNINLIHVQPSLTRKILQEYFNIKKTTKNHSIEYILEQYKNIKFTKYKNKLEHIADAFIAYDAYKKYMEG